MGVTARAGTKTLAFSTKGKSGNSSARWHPASESAKAAAAPAATAPLDEQEHCASIRLCPLHHQALQKRPFA
jgi:hypothetical protein